MTYAASELIRKVRDLISDTEEPFRWPDSLPAVGQPGHFGASMLDWANEAAAAMFENHPEFYYVDSVVTTPPTTLTATTDTLTTTQSGQKILINYTAYRCLARDNEDPETMQQAERFLQAYAMGV
jgi:hypothetical protein